MRPNAQKLWPSSGAVVGLRRTIIFEHLTQALHRHHIHSDEAADQAADDRGIGAGVAAELDGLGDGFLINPSEIRTHTGLSQKIHPQHKSMLHRIRIF